MKKTGILGLWVAVVLTSRLGAADDSHPASTLPLAGAAAQAQILPPAEDPNPVPAPAAAESSKAGAEPVPGTAHGPDAAPVAPLPPLVGPAGPGSCCGGNCCGHKITCHALCEWLTYRPLSRPGLAGCCHTCSACCMPPLYTFFPCYGGPGVLREVRPPCADQGGCANGICGGHHFGLGLFHR